MTKLEQLVHLSMRDPVIHRYMTMYNMGKYQNIEECLYEIIFTLSSIKDKLTTELYNQISHTCNFDVNSLDLSQIKRKE